MAFVHLDAIAAREIVKGYHGKFVHTDHLTMAFWEIEAGATLPEHAHIHEQITSVLAGQFEMTVAGETRLLEAGMVAVIPGGVRHSGRAITPCRLVDAFHPARDDYK
jgi:quercetin dioxygenase-like cupin family protein